MNYEEKYNQALERARECLKDGTISSKAIAYIEDIFPELKESEDERIRKKLISFVENWKKYNPNSPFDDYAVYTSDSGECDKILAWLEQQGEQPTKIEPKFKVGDWITDGYVGGLITSIEDNYPCYKIADFMGGINTSIPFTLQDNYHLWTIEDAKDGDVLAINWHEYDDSWEKIIIFKKYHNKGVKGIYSMPCVEGYGNTFKNGKLAFQEEIPYYSETWTANLHPATKEQRDLLFKKIHDAGYEWDAEKKGLTIKQAERF